MEKPKFKTVQEMDIPAIDLSILLSSSDDGREELRKLHSALSTWEKQKYARETGSFQGYGNDMILLDDQVLDWTDRLYLTTYPEDQRKLKFWPKVPIEFRETLHEYTMKQHLLVEKFYKAIARSLGLKDNRLREMCGENAAMETRFNMYPPCPRPGKVLGIKPHADGSAFTLLLPEKNVEGLQFFKDGKWYKDIMSNGIYKSPVHRVVTNKEKERISVATFCNEGPDTEIEPVDELMSEAKTKIVQKD
ncbi:hypothetical protein F2Q70_00004890 [Brassica cretica]|uniref:Fe2OG dioxygenase domain-containing protein n=1 Tax=Brassica cretica TaxID=69181 RepID=A0A8S9IZV3_BRACR|nr:hypothetical protein F2Q70_00004890 [Brassica cretica]